MKPLPETPRFPTLNTLLVVLVSLIPASALVYLVYALMLSTEAAVGSLAYIEQIIRLLAVGSSVLILSIMAFTALISFAIDHLSGRNHFGDDTPASSVFADAYAITSAYVLPYAYHFTDRHGDHFCDLHLSFPYAEILHVYKTLAKRHRLTFHFRSLSLPSHLGRRTPLLTRAGAKQLLHEMHDVAEANGETVQQQYAVLRYTFCPHYSDDTGLPDHQAFISRDIIRELLGLINSDGAEIEAFYDAENMIALSADYLQATYTRIASEDELVYLPISPA